MQRKMGQGNDVGRRTVSRYVQKALMPGTPGVSDATDVTGVTDASAQ